MEAQWFCFSNFVKFDLGKSKKIKFKIFQKIETKIK